MAQKKSGKNGGKGGAAAGLLGLAAAAVAGAYFLYGSKEGAKRRAKVKGWMLRAKGEVLDKLETMKDVNEETYNKVVDTVADKYKKVKGIDLAELAAMTADLKRHWGNIRKQMQPAKKTKPARSRASKSSTKKQSDSK